MKTCETIEEGLWEITASGRNTDGKKRRVVPPLALDLHSLSHIRRKCSCIWFFASFVRFGVSEATLARAASATFLIKTLAVGGEVIHTMC